MNRLVMNKGPFKSSSIAEGILSKEKMLASVVCTLILVLGLCFVLRNVSSGAWEDNLTSFVTDDYLERVGIIPSVPIQEVTPELTERGQGGSRRFRAELGDFTADFDSSSPGVYASSSSGGTIRFELQSTPVSSVSRRSNSLIYSSLGSPVEVKYLATPGRIKEDIILKQKPQTNTLTFNFSASGLNAVRLSDGYHFFDSKSGKESFWVLNPTVVDKHGAPGKISMVIAGNTCTYIVDSAFLAKATYPVTVDPVMVSPTGGVQYSWHRQMVRTSSGRIVLFYWDHLTAPLTGPGIYYRTSDPPYESWSNWTKVGGTSRVGCDALIDDNDNIYLTYDNPYPYLVKFTYSSSGGGTLIRSFQTLDMGSGYISSLALEGGRLWSAGNVAGANNVRYSDDGGATWHDSTMVPGVNTRLTSFGNKLALFYMRSMGGNNRWELFWRWRNNSDAVTSWSGESKITDVYMGSKEDGPYSVTSDDSGLLHLLYCSSYMFAPDNPSRDGLFYTKYDGSWSAPLRLDGGMPHPNSSWQALGYRVYPKWPSITTDGSNLWAYYSNPEPWPGNDPAYRYRLAYRKWSGASWESKAHIYPFTSQDFGDTQATTMERDPTLNAVAWMRDLCAGRQIWFHGQGVPPPNHPPVADPNGPYVSDMGQGITLDGSASYDPDPGDYIATWEWDLDNDGAFDDATGATPTISWTQIEALGLLYPADPADGLPKNTIRLRVTDSRGATDEGSTTLTIYENRPVAVASASPTTANVGETITFDGSLSYHTHPDHSIVKYEWDFESDGIYDKEGKIVTYAYSSPGTYVATLRVTDDNILPKTDTDTQIINVEPLGPITRIGPCCIDSPPEYPHSDGIYNYDGPWYDEAGNPIPPDEQRVRKTLPFDVDVVHSLWLNTFDKDTGEQKDELYLGNVSPIEGYQDPTGKNGHGEIDISIKSNDEWIKSISWTGFTGVEGDDAEGYSLPSTFLTAWVNGAKITSPWESNIITDHESVESLEVDLEFNPGWHDHAGMYQSTMTISATQI